MNLASRASLIHLTDSNRGGSQRHILDLVRSEVSGFRPYIVRANSEAVDVTDVNGLRVLALDPRRLDRGLATVVGALRRTLGVAGLHGHALEPLLGLAEAADRPLAGLPYVVTLHDLRAVDPDCFIRPTGDIRPDARWIARCRPLLEGAARIIVPSEWLRGVVGEAYPGIDAEVIANGIDDAVPVAGVPIESPLPASTRTYAVVGAIGEHKGRRMMEEVAASITDPDIVGVVIGYTDTRDEPGWLVPGKLYLHGRYQVSELRALLAAYGCRIAWFPNVVPESFSYVLSEVWQADVPALVPDAGALGARMRAVHGGWLLDTPTPAGAARQIATLLAPDAENEVAAARARIAAADGAVPTLAAMRAAVDAVHRASFAGASPVEPEPGWRALGALLHAGREPGLDESLLDAQWPTLAREERALRNWNSKLGADVAALDASTQRLHAQFEVSVLRNRALAADIDALKSRNARIEADAAALDARARRSDEALALVTERNRVLERDFAEGTRRNAELEQHVIALRERNARVEADVGALIARNLQLEGDVVALTGRIVELQADIAGLKERNTIVEAGLAAIGQRNIRVESDAAQLQAELAALESDLAARRRRMARLEYAVSRLPRPLQNWLMPDA